MFSRKHLGLTEQFETPQKQFEELQYLKHRNPSGLIYRSELSWAKFAPGYVAQTDQERQQVFERLATPPKNFLKLKEEGQLPPGYAGGSAVMEHEIEVCY